MLVGLAAYAVLGGADFGAAFWQLGARGERGVQLREQAYRAMGPVWEAALGIVLRGTAYAVHAGTAREIERRAVDGVFSISSILTPLALGIAVGAIASGRVPVGNARAPSPAGSTRRRSPSASWPSPPAPTWLPSTWPETALAPVAPTLPPPSAAGRWERASVPGRSR
jgi:hypothetical protein